MISSFTDILWNNFDSLYTNVVVRPTRREIRHATQNRIYSQIENPLNISCPISLEPFANNNEVRQIIGCGHLFNPDNLESWFETNVRCPVCRYDIRTPIHRNHVVPTATGPTLVNASGVEESKEAEAEESKEDLEEESKEELEEENNTQERNRMPRTSSSRDNANLTEAVLTSLFNQTSLFNPTNLLNDNRFTFDSTNSRMVFDSSNNEIVFHGYYAI